MTSYLLAGKRKIESFYFFVISLKCFLFYLQIYFQNIQLIYIEKLVVRLFQKFVETLIQSSPIKVKAMAAKSAQWINRFVGWTVAFLTIIGFELFRGS